MTVMQIHRQKTHTVSAGILVDVWQLWSFWSRHRLR